jgi:uncharacterized protein (DUF433 family)
MGGEIVGTRVPAYYLFDWLKAGETLDYFLDNFPSVKRTQAVAAIEFGCDALLATAKPTKEAR